ncbi:hypothetical protein VNO78_22365 [Psophocarpus tetragonolobus]|uniref:Uncharacterized protein n=1 Tax=Psophocarpus tetragonolobus TaxID=3891 RepID=A0AAN9XJ04_PSOTE
MDVVLTAGSEDVNSVEETKMIANTTTTGNTIMSEEAPKIHRGFGSRIRRKSKYLRYPYIAPEDLRTQKSCTYSKKGNKRFQKNPSVQARSMAMPIMPQTTMSTVMNVNVMTPVGSTTVSNATPSQQIGSVTPTQATGSMAMTCFEQSRTMPSVTLSQPIGSTTMVGVTHTIQTGPTMTMQPTQSIPTPSQEPPSLEFMKQNLEMMASTLENSGNSLSPEMRAKLHVEIKNLLQKVNSRLNV